jgi:hypothetical protein
MDPDVLWRLDLNGRVKSRGANTAHDLYILLTAESIRPYQAGWCQDVPAQKMRDFAFFHSTTVVSRPLMQRTASPHPSRPLVGTKEFFPKKNDAEPKARNKH